jgi:nucleotide-binding universal stress UspA family protein
MPGWSRICCAVDLSDPSRTALRQAAELARATGAELTLLHVVPPARAATVAAGVLAGAGDDVVRSMLAALEEELQPWKAEAERLAGRPVTLVVAPGVPADGIVRFARDGGFDLVVLATHGHTGVRRLVLGSVAERVVREATVPVLVVRAPAAGAAAPAG